MKKQLMVITFTAAGLMGQTDQDKLRVEAQLLSNSLQQATTMGGGTFRVMPDAVRGQLVTGSPVSAKEVNRTVQTLSDGTEIENTQTTMFYRDAQGRTRTEPSGTDGIAIIQDPVAGVRITLNSTTRTAIRATTPALALAKLGAVTAKLEAEMTARTTLDGAPAKSTTVKLQANSEDLGFQNQNGILAQGTRNTMIIPKGQIGNNRDIKVVNERWYSKDLQMVVKSVNSDPRFGTTTYELTNVVQGADPTLFQIPGNYTVTESAGRGGGFGGGGVVVGGRGGAGR
jgi:hypothetical protein